MPAPAEDGKSRRPDNNSGGPIDIALTRLRFEAPEDSSLQLLYATDTLNAALTAIGAIHDWAEEIQQQPNPHRFEANLEKYGALNKNMRDALANFRMTITNFEEENTGKPKKKRRSPRVSGALPESFIRCDSLDDLYIYGNVLANQYVHAQSPLSAVKVYMSDYIHSSQMHMDGLDGALGGSIARLRQIPDRLMGIFAHELVSTNHAVDVMKQRMERSFIAHNIAVQTAVDNEAKNLSVSWSNFWVTELADHLADIIKHESINRTLRGRVGIKASLTEIAKGTHCILINVTDNVTEFGHWRNFDRHSAFLPNLLLATTMDRHFGIILGRDVNLHGIPPFITYSFANPTLHIHAPLEGQGNNVPLLSPGTLPLSQL